MKTELTEKQIKEYRDNGVVIHRGLLDAQEVNQLKKGVLNAIQKMGVQKTAEGSLNWKDTDDSAFYQSVFTQRIHLRRIDDAVKRCMQGPELGKMIATLSGNEKFRIYLDQALIKEPYGNPTAWHLDAPYWPFCSSDSISVWIALEESTLSNGCMHFVPGSHKLARHQENVPISENLGRLFHVYPEMAQIDPIPAVLQPGDCTFHNGNIAHGAGANMTRSRRIAIVGAYMPVGSVFNGKQDILPPDYFATLKKGDILENDDWNPVLR